MRKAIPLNLTTGCFAKIKEFFKNLFKKKPVEVHKSNYSIVYVDMATATSKVLVEELIDIVDYHEGELFYFVPDNDPESEAIHFMCCDVLTGETKELLDDKCDRCIEREMQNGMSIVFDKLDKCLAFGTTDGVYVSLYDIDRIKKELTGRE